MGADPSLQLSLRSDWHIKSIVMACKGVCVGMGQSCLFALTGTGLARRLAQQSAVMPSTRPSAEDSGYSRTVAHALEFLFDNIIFDNSASENAEIKTRNRREVSFYV